MRGERFWTVYKMTLFIKIHERDSPIRASTSFLGQEKSMRINEVAKCTDKSDIYCEC